MHYLYTFKQVNWQLAALLHGIEIGEIGFLEVQRPFSWSATKVRDFLDSMYRGFPIGVLLLWANAELEETKAFQGCDKTNKVPKLLIVDGQQRLTLLYEVFRSKKVINEASGEASIKIAFRPSDGKFEVADSAIQNDPEFINNISNIWNAHKLSDSLTKDFLKSLREKRDISDEEENTISHNLNRIFALPEFPFVVQEIAKNVTRVQIVDIFNRANS